MSRLIEAEELKHILNNSKYYGTKAGNAFADMITECETIKERKKGKWIKRGKIFQCPECEKFSITQDNYCPNCGADMREEKTDEQEIH